MLLRSYKEKEADDLFYLMWKSNKLAIVGFVVAGQFVTVAYYPFLWIALSMHAGLSNFEAMKSLWSGLVDQVAFVDYNPWENVYDADKTGVNSPCSDLWRRMFIWWDGKIAMCDVDYLTKLSKETVQNKTISDVWNGETYTNLRKKHISRKRCNIEPCSRCIVV